jgi:hypothetical protein
MRLLPEQSLWYTVNTAQPVRRSLLLSAVCHHVRATSFKLVDHRSNPPPYQDVYAGTVCVTCGKVLTKQQVY